MTPAFVVGDELICKGTLGCDVCGATFSHKTKTHVASTDGETVVCEWGTDQRHEHRFHVDELSNIKPTFLEVKLNRPFWMPNPFVYHAYIATLAK